ncbi:unconventional prefoldin RPB5 interactor-like protein [Contarinia nasturtii]|uniref:unconventional prefoldin RPB5 interactor-like protein n=1 Tax=Contarinia nasturtii TaxID=265458 RepID=UPI0012D43146|nr:unconventional prefoldin RPB5 interactor-like protein [Contarinia nasturtii]
MELLLQAIDEKLSRADCERNKWLQYKEEHNQAADNLREFQKSLCINVLVPIGAKAFMPGQLYHTNEIFVGTYRGLFIKCSTDKALAVCQHRLDEADKKLASFNIEYQMYKDRLDMNKSAFGTPNEGGEIIEEYNEEEEMKWREQHRIRVREHKKVEAEERRRQHMESDIDIDAIFEQAELMEELERELAQLNVSDDEQLQRHLDNTNDEQAENVDLARDGENEDNANDGDDHDGDESKEFLTIKKQAIGLDVKDKIKFYEIHLQKLQVYFKTTQCTLHNFDEFADKRVTEENLQNAIDELQETLDENVIETESKTSKDNQMEEQTNEPRKYLSRTDYDRIEQEYIDQNRSRSELLVFYKSQLRNMMKLIGAATLDDHSKNEKRILYEFVSDRISSLRIEIQQEKQIKFEEDFVDDEDIDQNAQQRTFDPNDSGFDIDDNKDDDPTGKRKISFASEPLTVTFCEDEEPFQLSKYAQENIERLMDESFQFFNSPTSSMSNSPGSPAGSLCSDDEDNTAREDEIEYQPVISTNDCDLSSMLQINESTMNKVKKLMDSAMEAKLNPKPLILEFNNSSNEPTAVVSDDNNITSPLDIYKQFGACIEASTHPVLSPRSLGQMNTASSPLNMSQIQNKLKEGDQDATISLEIPNIDAKPQKSILKNSILVKNELRAPVNSDDVEDPSNTNDQPRNDDFPVFTQVLGDIVERSDPVESTLTLPDDTQSRTENQPSGDNPSGRRVDNQPKKKPMSKFKKSRMR